jgi:hypothetical protein
VSKSGVRFVASTTSMRVWRASKDANRPVPKLSDDPVIDFLIIEALAAKDLYEQGEARKMAEIEEWKKDTQSLEDRIATAQ